MPLYKNLGLNCVTSIHLLSEQIPRPTVHKCTWFKSKIFLTENAGELTSVMQCTANSQKGHSDADHNEDLYQHCYPQILRKVTSQQLRNERRHQTSPNENNQGMVLRNITIVLSNIKTVCIALFILGKPDIILNILHRLSCHQQDGYVQKKRVCENES